ncbi:flagellin [Opitutales bacterium]|nr:flagellin [Opitutales bacterium]
MVSPINNNLTGLVFEASNNKSDLENIVAKLSSGKKNLRVGEDSGAHSQSAKIGSKSRRDIANVQNLQNLVSYSNSQDGVLESVGNIINRMGELAARALDITASVGDRENYNKEFLELADQLDQFKKEDFNGVQLFGAGSFSDEKKDFIDSLKNNWIHASETLIKAEYGWDTVPSDSWNLIVNENDTGGYAAFVMTSQNPLDGTADVIEMQFDLPDFSAPHKSPTSTADRTVAHEMVHLMQAQNSYYGDITGDGSSRGTWFKEGLAEFIHGNDYSVKSILDGNTDDFSALTNAIGTGNEGWSTGEQYATGYLAVKYLHARIKASSVADTGGVSKNSGIKHMTTWMKNQYDSSAGASSSGIDDYFQNFNIPKATGGTNFSSNADFITNYKGIDGQNFISSLRTSGDFSNDDTGAIHGKDENRSATDLTSQIVVPDTSGTPASTFIEEEDNSSLAASVDGTGTTYDLKSVNTITVLTDTYNLESIDNARNTLIEIENLLTNLSAERANVGANLSRLEKELNNLSGKITNGEMALSRIEDADIAKESSRFASTQVRMQASIAILAQGQQLNVGIPDLLRGVNIGG